VTEDQFKKLKEWIVAIIAEKMSHDTSDGGLIESCRLFDVEAEVRALLVTQEDA
jgi:hypothetical protein